MNTKPAQRYAEVLNCLHSFGPISAHEIAKRFGIRRCVVDKHLARAKQDDLAHISGFEPSPFREHYTVKLWTFGPGDDAKRTYWLDRVKAEKGRARRQAQPPRRDPFIAAFFGASA
jgi:hypothetical protein